MASDTPKPSEIEPNERPDSLVEGDASVPGTNPPAAVPEHAPESVGRTPAPDRVDDPTGASDPS